jgi:hypothetical protein
MSVFYDLASLVLVPSGYKSGKVYSQKPLTTDGQLDFTRASTATRVNASGLVEAVASGVPRLDYLNSTCPRLLLEPSSTTLLPFSEQLDNAAWDKPSAGAAITANSVTSPDGYTNADTITGTGAGVLVLVRQFITVAAAGTYTFSGFYKYNNHPFVSLNLSQYDGGGDAYYNIQTGVVTNVSAGSTAKIEDYGNGWYRCSLTSAIGASDLSGRANVFVAKDGTTNEFLTEVDAAGKAAYAWGFNMCLGSYVQSYIPTLGASVTRVVDKAEKTSASALIGQTEGTIFWEIQVDTPAAAGHEDILNLDAGSYGNTIYLLKGASNTLIAEVYVSSALQASFSTTISAGTYKCALGYANNNTAFFINGVQIGSTDTSCSVPATNRIQLGNGIFGPSTGLTKQLLLFKTRLTNAQLSELTAL